MITREQIVEAARKYLGCPFHHQGRSKDGMDCIGLVVMTGIDLGYDIVDLEAYNQRDIETLDKYFDINFVKVEKARLGSITVHLIMAGLHVCIISGDNKMITSGKKIIQEVEITDYWTNSLIRIYDYKGL